MLVQGTKEMVQIYRQKSKSFLMLYLSEKGKFFVDSSIMSNAKLRLSMQEVEPKISV